MLFWFWRNQILVDIELYDCAKKCFQIKSHSHTSSDDSIMKKNSGYVSEVILSIAIQSLSGTCAVIQVHTIKQVANSTNRFIAVCFLLYSQHTNNLITVMFHKACLIIKNIFFKKSSRIQNSLFAPILSSFFCILNITGPIMYTRN